MISDNYNLDEVLQGALDRIIDFGLCQAVCVHLVAEDQAHLKMFTSHGLSKIQHDQLQRLPLDGDLSEWFTDRQKQVLTLDLSSVTTSITPLRLEGYNYLLGVPMDTRSQILGLISYYRAEDQPYSLDDISMLTALAEQLRIIIENHRLRDEIEEIAIVSERQRLARDMHDSINQSLYSLGLFTLAGREAAEDGDTERLIKSLKRIEEISLDARLEMRLLLHQLRPPILTGLGLAEALQYRFDTVERSLGTRVDYQVDGHLDLPDKTAEGLYWVTLEILNNSLKHSKANQVTVRMEMVAPTINMKVSDNGIGFNPELASGGMGLKNIEERIDEMDGCLKISSAPGEGTTIEFAVSVPEMSDTGED
jgi:signal transduction histidine kinase